MTIGHHSHSYIEATQEASYLVQIFKLHAQSLGIYLIHKKSFKGDDIDPYVAGVFTNIQETCTKILRLRKST